MNLPTSRWFLNSFRDGPGMWQHLHFSNSQYVGIAAKGDITVYRPKIWAESNYPTPYYTINYPNDLTCDLKLGDIGQNGNGDMLFYTDLNSKYDGFAGLTQLVTADYSNPAYMFYNERCDGKEFYSGPNHVSGTSNPNIANGVVQLDDGPSSIWATPNTIDISARDFIRFQPSGGIWVTLGIVRWNTHGTAETILVPDHDWNMTSEYTSPPIGPDSSDEFPHWTINQSGMH